MDIKEHMPQSSVSTIGKGMRKHILVHCKSCPTCAKQRVHKTQFEKQIFEPGVQPMEFICIDLIGEFYPPSSKGNRYALTAVCMLTGFTFCIPIKNKTAQEVVTAWRNHISFLLSGTNSMAEPDACPMPQWGPCTSMPIIYKVLP